MTRDPKPAGATARARRLLLLLALVSSVSACAVGARAPLTGALDSAEAVAQAILDALANRDEAGLRRLALSEHEFRTVLWPVLPASRPEASVPFDYAWGTLAQNSAGHLAGLLRAHGGRRYRLDALEFAGETTAYGAVVVHRKSRMRVVDERGEPRALALFGSLIERQGEFKVVSYVVD